MNRREFTTAVGAGLVFPVDLLASLAKQEVEPPKSAGKITIVCLGSDDNPATTSQMEAYIEVIDIMRHFRNRPLDKTLRAMSRWSDLDTVVYEEVELKGLAFILGSKNRPPSQGDFEDTVDALAGIKAGDTFVTHHSMIPHRYEDSRMWIGVYDDVVDNAPIGGIVIKKGIKASKTDVRWLMSLDYRTWDLDFDRKLKRIRPSKIYSS